MRKLIILILLTALSCNRSEYLDYTKLDSYISGNIDLQLESPNVKLKLFDLITDESYSLLANLDSSNNFSLPITLSYAQPFIISTPRPYHFLIFPPDSVNIDVSDSIKVNCSNKDHEFFIFNYHYLYNLLQSFQSDPDALKHVREKSALDYKIYLHSERKKLIGDIEKFLQRNNINNENFSEMAYTEIDYIIATMLIDYKFLNQDIFKRKIETPPDYFKFVDSLTQADTKLITYNYFMFLNRAQVLYNPYEIDKFLGEINYAPSSKTEEILLCRGIYFVLEKDGIASANKYLAEYSPLLKNQFIKDLFEEKYSNKLNHLENPQLGSVNLYDLTNNEEVTNVIDDVLAEHKNKVIYFKFWAPWCGPCMAEAPFAKQLYEKYSSKDFELVNFCVDTSPERWKATIAEKKLAGSHYLLNTEQYQQLSTLLNINGIPHYSLIDKKGLIVEKNALNPGSAFTNELNQELIQMIENLLK